MKMPLSPSFRRRNVTGRKCFWIPAPVFTGVTFLRRNDGELRWETPYIPLSGGAGRRLFCCGQLALSASSGPSAGRKPQAGRRAERKRPQSARPGALGEATACLPQGLWRTPHLLPCVQGVRAFFVALYRPGPLAVGTNSPGNFLPSLIRMVPSRSQSPISATGPPGCRCGTSGTARWPRTG